MGLLLSFPRRTGHWSSAQTAAARAEVTSHLLHGHFLTSAQKVMFFSEFFSQFIIGYTDLKVALEAQKLLLFFYILLLQKNIQKCRNICCIKKETLTPNP